MTKGNDNLVFKLKAGRKHILLTLLDPDNVGVSVFTSSKSKKFKQYGNGAVGGGGNRHVSVSRVDLRGNRGGGDDGCAGFTILASGGGGGGRGVVRPILTRDNVHAQIAPHLPAILGARNIWAARTPEQRALLSHPVWSRLVRVHPNGGGLVFVGANIPPNMFVGLCNWALPGSRGSNKATLMYNAILAGSLYGYGVLSGHAFAHTGSRIQDHAVVGEDAFIDQWTWIGGKITVGGSMNIITDSTGHLVLGGFGNVVGDFDIVGGGKLMLGSHAYQVPRQINDLVRSCRI